MADPKKTLYHGELKGAGRAVVDVTSDVLMSKYKKPGEAGHFIVNMRLNGYDRTYSCENQTCAARFNGPDGKSRKGQRLTIEATGGGKGQEATADILVHAAEWTPAGGAAPVPQPQAALAQPPSPAPAAPAPQPQSAPQASPAPTVATPAPQPAQPAGPKPPPNGMTCNGRLFQLMNLELRVQCAMSGVVTKLAKERQIQITPEQYSGMVGRAFIQLCREFYLDTMPHNKLVDITPKESAPTQQPAQPAASQPPPAQPDPDPSDA